MEQFLEGFGINPLLLIAQVVNFLLLLYLLKRFLYKPVLNMLHERARKIETSLKHAKEIEDERKKISEERQKTLEHAKGEAAHIIEATVKTADKTKAHLTQQAELTAKRILEEARAESGAERAKIMQAAQSEIGDLVISLGSQLLKRKVTQDEDRRLIKELIKAKA